MRNLTVFIILSLLIHFSSFKGLEVFASKWGVPSFVSDLTEIEITEKEEETEEEKPDDLLDRSKERPIVRQLTPIDPIDSRQDARFESEKDQRVLQETKARDFGRTENRNANEGSDLPQMPISEEKLDFSDEGSLPEFARQIRTGPAITESKISMELPSDIQFSDVTNLNTDANIYYAFYQRVEDLYRIRWEQRLEYYWKRLSFEFKRDKLAGQIWSTVFEVKLRSNGEYDSAIILRSSNYRPFDEAAIFSFKDARYFPNPPKEKVDPDGFIRLKYRFSVHVSPIR